MITKKNIFKFFYLFLFSHVLIWTIIPSITNENLPLDTIEALAWGSDLDWGFNKHPPFSAFAVEFIYEIFGSEDWAYYFLSQIFVSISFLAVFYFAKDFFEDIYLAFFSVLTLVGVFFFNFTTPEFNVNISQLPFWSLSILFTWRCIKYNKFIDYIFLGLSFGFGMLSKYLFLYLIFSIKCLFIYLFLKKKLKLNYIFASSIITLLIILPHLIWLSDNEFITLFYGFKRAGGIGQFSDHFVFPTVFIIKQFIILSPVFLMTFFLLKKIKIKKITIDFKMIFLSFTFILPILLVILTSIVMGAKIRTMWMTPFYLIVGVFILHILRKNFNLKNYKRFFFIFTFLFVLSPSLYFTVSEINEFKRTDYPGKEIARLVQNKWDDNFSNEIKVVVGDEWYAGNLSYHLNSRPKWMIELKNKEKINSKEGVIYTGNPKILKKICPGIYGTIKPVGYCMIGRK